MQWLSVVLISGALVAYTAGVWAERRRGELLPWHAAAFALGLLCDATGTWLMAQKAAAGQLTAATPLATTLNVVMATTGTLALGLMALHLAWAVVVLWKNRPEARIGFHKFSVAVWLVWLLPYFTGMAAAMVGRGALA